MFPARYYAPRYFAPRYFAEVGQDAAAGSDNDQIGSYRHYGSGGVSLYGDTESDAEVGDQTGSFRQYGGGVTKYPS
jgi:hypothetical protein